MSWDHCHYDNAFAVFLTCGEDELHPPDAVFRDEGDAERWIEAERVRECADDPVLGRTPADCYHEAAVHEVRNVFVPFWNNGIDPIPDEKPPPIPDYEGTIVGPDREFLATFFYRVSMVCACLRNFSRSHVRADVDGAIAFAKEVSSGLEEFNSFFREMR
jgi:hypothetical protein